jgi:FkbM family methyltransferase
MVDVLSRGSRIPGRLRNRYRRDGWRGLTWAAARRVAGPPPAPPTNAARVDPTPMDAVLQWLAEQPTFAVVQIGAYVGNTANDPLYPFLTRELPRHPGSTALLVEPVATYYEQLVAAYDGVAGAAFEHAAIADAAGERDFYRIDVDPRSVGKPVSWDLGQLSSLRADRMEELWSAVEQIPEVQAYYREHRVVERVTCLTYADLITRHGLTQIDLLQIDAEGYDFQILSSIDFSASRPRFINYERILLRDDEPACRALLEAAGYVLFDWDIDTMAVARG